MSKSTTLLRHCCRAKVEFKQVLFPQQSLKSFVFNANTHQRAWAVLATCFLLLKVALWCIRTNWFNMCSLPSEVRQSCRKHCKASTANVQWFSNEMWVTMTLSPVSHRDAHTVVFTVVCIVERLNFSHFYSAGNTCHIKSIFFPVYLWAGGVKVGQQVITIT